MNLARRMLLASLCALGLGACAASAQLPADPPRVLIFSHSTGYRHASIEPGIEALRAMGARAGYEMVASEDINLISNEGLADFDAIILLSTSTPREAGGDFLVGERQEALDAFFNRGGGLVGIHAAAGFHHSSTWFTRMLGGRLDDHPPGVPSGTIDVIDRNHPATRGMPAHAVRTDEWYYMRDLEPDLRVLVTIEPSSIGQPDPGPKLLSWAHEFEGGRVFYTAMGHTPESYSEPLFINHVAGGLRWALRLED